MSLCEFNECASSTGDGDKLEKMLKMIAQLGGDDDDGTRSDDAQMQCKIRTLYVAQLRFQTLCLFLSIQPVVPRTCM